MTRPTYTAGRVYMGRLQNGADVLETITRIANEEGVKAGLVEAHGIVSRVAVSRYDGQTRTMIPVEHDELAQIVSMSGTISQFKGRSLARLDALLVRNDGSLVAGVVTLGTIVHACEVVVTELAGPTISRDFDMESGLPLWKNEI